MSLWVFLVVAVLLSLECICDLWVWRWPESFHAFCARPVVAAFGEPVVVLQKLFYCFKVIQGAVFLAWCYWYGYGLPWPLDGGIVSLVIGCALIVAGQVLNFGVFYRLGKIGVFYGNKFGYEVPWSYEFPFSLLNHPQYVGALVSIWGFFLAIGFPHDDWYMLPTLQTAYYLAGAHLER